MGMNDLTSIIHSATIFRISGVTSSWTAGNEVHAGEYLSSCRNKLYKTRSCSNVGSSYATLSTGDVCSQHKRSIISFLTALKRNSKKITVFTALARFSLSELCDRFRSLVTGEWGERRPGYTAKRILGSPPPLVESVAFVFEDDHSRAGGFEWRWPLGVRVVQHKSLQLLCSGVKGALICENEQQKYAALVCLIWRRNKDKACATICFATKTSNFCGSFEIYYLQSFCTFSKIPGVYTKFYQYSYHLDFVLWGFS